MAVTFPASITKLKAEWGNASNSLYAYRRNGGIVGGNDTGISGISTTAPALGSFVGAAHVTTAVYTTLFYPVTGSGLTNPSNGYANDGVFATGVPPSLGTVSGLYSNFRSAGSTLDSIIAAGATINWVNLHAKGKVASVVAPRQHTMNFYCVAIATLWGGATLTTTNAEYTTGQITGITRASLLDATFVATVDMINVAGTSSTCSLDCVWLEVNYTQ